MFAYTNSAFVSLRLNLKVIYEKNIQPDFHFYLQHFICPGPVKIPATTSHHARPPAGPHHAFG
jgi:hypothetical protein